MMIEHEDDFAGEGVEQQAGLDVEVSYEPVDGEDFSFVPPPNPKRFKFTIQEEVFAPPIHDIFEIQVEIQKVFLTKQAPIKDDVLIIGPFTKGTEDKLLELAVSACCELCAIDQEEIDLFGLTRRPHLQKWFDRDLYDLDIEEVPDNEDEEYEIERKAVKQWPPQSRAIAFQIYYIDTQGAKHLTQFEEVDSEGKAKRKHIKFDDTDDGDEESKP